MPRPAAPSFPPVLVAAGSTVLLVGVLLWAKTVIMPIALAVLLTFVLTPVAAAFEHRVGLKRLYAVILTSLLAAVLAGGLGWVVARQVQGLAAEIPKHKHEIQQKVDSVRGSAGGAFGELLKMIEDVTAGPPAAGTAAPPGEDPPAGPPVRPVVLTQPKESGAAHLLEQVLPVVEPLATAGLVVVLVVFMLVNKEDLRDRLLGLIGHGRLSAATRAMADAGERVGTYLLSLLAVNVVFGAVFAVGLWLLGVPFAVLWGFLAAVLRFIPFLGTWAAAAFPIVLSVALSPGWAQPLSVLAFFVLLDVLAANVVEPLLFGHGTGISPIALLVAAAFWAWVWGPIGLLLATPLTVCLVVLGQHVPRLGFLSLLLGNTPALPPPARLYQRLFARDEREAAGRVAEYAAEHGTEAAFDDMVIPALVLARRDREQGGLTADGEEFALDAVRGIVRKADEAAGPGPEPLGTVVACTAHHPAEEPTLDMLAHLLRPDRVFVEALPAKALPADVAERVAELSPAAVFISVLPPGGLPQAAYLCRMLRKRFPGLQIVVGWWGSERQYDRLLVRLRAAGATYVTTSLRQSRTQLRFVAAVPPPEAADGVPPPAAVGAAP